jgi:hypothetical protein
MVNWVIYYKIGSSMHTAKVTCTNEELADQLKHYEYIMEVRRIYD